MQLTRHSRALSDAIGPIAKAELLAKRALSADFTSNNTSFPPHARPLHCPLTHHHTESIAASPPHTTVHMSEAQSRPARGRTTARGGRGGGYGSRGARNTNGDSASSKIDTSAEQGELGELKKRYSSQLTTLKELFPDWSDADLVLAIEEADGDLERTVERISEGERLPAHCLHVC